MTVKTSKPEKDKKDDKAPTFAFYRPVKRTTDELFGEDTANAEFYRCVADDDEDIVVTGATGNALEEHGVSIEYKFIFLYYIVFSKWEEAGFEKILLENIYKAHYIRPRKIQSFGIPLLMEGRDVQALAETGSGKTGAFMLPIINYILKNKDFSSSDVELGRPSVFAIVIEPTRELCGQVADQGRKFADGTGVTVAQCYGKYNMSGSRTEIMMGCDILCATPGRLKHILTSKWVMLDKLKFFVLDEADHLLEEGFIEVKEKRQNILFSATYPDEIQVLAHEVLRDNFVMVTNRKPNATNSKIKQTFISIKPSEKKKVINFDLPMDGTTYVHRIGRTGRIKNGFATSFFDETSADDCKLAKDYVKFMVDSGQEPPEFLKNMADGIKTAPIIVDAWADVEDEKEEETPVPQQALGDAW